ncbi:hypothetical protein GE061_014371 [Apolygus lucorum]|uniref:DDE Tnp4 domain-containing protein n=1 Tax=Apolygus lucorum TaxID=248454 RepID=A0A8S9XRK6_APOLU|nr:hypothetical protein GE061_014371 [Apolygus lucorum]
MDIVSEFVALHQRGLVEWEEVEMAYEAYFVALGGRRSPIFRSVRYGKFDLRGLTDDQIFQNMRFQRADLALLKECFQIPDEVTIPQRGYRVPGMTALCILLKRLSYPNRLCDLEAFFGMSSAAISSVAKEMTNHVISRKGYLLATLESHTWLNAEKLEYYAEAVARKGAPLNNCWAFIDGTARHICRPSVNQEMFYSGHKRYHCLKFQSTVTPDGLIISLLGPFDGRRHDAGIFRETGFINQLQRLCENAANQYVLYGDAAYPISDLLLKPFPQTSTEDHAIYFNRAMSAVRQAVEWGFGKVVRDWAFVDFHKNLKILKQDVSSMYKVACLLSNCHSCLYGSQVSDFFSINPPTLEQYLQHERR